MSDAAREYTQNDLDNGLQALRHHLSMDGDWLWDVTSVKYEGKTIRNPDRVRFYTVMPEADAAALQYVLHNDPWFARKYYYVPFEHPNTGTPMARFYISMPAAASEEFISHIPATLKSDMEECTIRNLPIELAASEAFEERLETIQASRTIPKSKRAQIRELRHIAGMIVDSGGEVLSEPPPPRKGRDR